MSAYKDDPFPNLIISYNQAADSRDKNDVSDWKKELRKEYLRVLKEEGKSTLIDIGAGTGVHAKYFQVQGIDVTCIDLSPALIEKCLKKSLRSYQANILEITGFEHQFGAAFALNSLLHVPTYRLQDGLSNISNFLEPDGIFFWGQYGGDYREGVYQDDKYYPKRFFSLLDDNQIREFASKYFTIKSFDRIIIKDMSPLYFQAMVLRVKTESK